MTESGLWEGLQAALQAQALLYCLAGVTLGTLVGVLPGIGPIAVMSILLPLTYALDTGPALMMMGGLWYGAAYGGAITAILLNIPGTLQATVTTIDGYPMARAGRAGPALVFAALASFAGGVAGIVVVMLAGPVLSNWARVMGPPEYGALSLLCLVIGAAGAPGSLRRGLLMASLGAILGLVGTDLMTGQPRLTLGLTALQDGIDIGALATGLFGLSEIALLMAGLRQAHPATRGAARMGPGMEEGQVGPPSRLQGLNPSRDEWARFPGAAMRGSMIGAVVGMVPGIGPTLAAYLAYGAERLRARDPSRFGRGAPEGVVAPEAANNACDQTGFVPTLVLGVPASAPMALVLVVLAVHGITPGPLFIAQHGDLFWALIGSFWIGNLALLILNIPLIGLWLHLLRLPARILYPATVLVVVAGTYLASGRMADLVVLALASLGGAMLRAAGYTLTPILLGFFLVGNMEQHVRRSLLIAQGRWSYLAEHPLALAFLGLAVLLIAVVSVRRHRLRRRAMQTA